MDFKQNYPDFAAIEKHIHKARVERSVAVAEWLAAAIVSFSRGLKNLAGSMGRNLAAERDRRAIEADSFLKRSVPRY
jgi:phosphate/sulfate permease